MEDGSGGAAGGAPGLKKLVAKAKPVLSEEEVRVLAEAAERRLLNA